MNVDISDLKKEKLPSGKFPVAHQEPFRVHFAPEVHAGTRAHASQDTTVEICGVLVGRWETDGNGPYAVVTNYIRCEQAAQKHAEVTFTQDSWTHINKEMDTKYQELRIVGWYHSHPDFGIFLSDRDCFIQQHFFSGPGQVALVIDPVRHLDGLFEWRDGKPCPMHHYWVGDKIHLGETRPPEQQAPKPDPYAPTESAVSSSESASAFGGSGGWLSTSVLVLGALVMFLFGQQLAMWQYRTELQINRLEAVEHYGLFKKERLGLEPRLGQVMVDIQLLAQGISALQGIEPVEADRKAYAAINEKMAAILIDAAGELEMMKQIYGHSLSEMDYYNQRYEDVHQPKSDEKQQKAPADSKSNSEIPGPVPATKPEFKPEVPVAPDKPDTSTAPEKPASPALEKPADTK